MYKKLQYNNKISDIYEVNESGDIKNSKTGRMIKWVIDRDGYARVHLRGNIQKLAGVHRIVMETFQGYSDLTVNHIDGNKLNNNIVNLEYCSALENLEHRYKNNIGLIKRFAVYQYDTNFHLLNIYKSAEQAAKENHTHSRSIKRACAGPYHRHKNYLYYRTPIEEDMVYSRSQEH